MKSYHPFRDWQDTIEKYPVNLNEKTLLTFPVCWYQYEKDGQIIVCILDKGHDEGIHEMEKAGD